MLCHSEVKVSKDGLIFGGQTASKEVTLCTFNLASGKCIDSKDMCMSNGQVSPTATSIMTTSVT